MLWTLNISKNDFDGCIPSSIGDMKELSTLDLSYNKLSGGIPEHLANSCIYLRYLVLSNNSLEGQIFSAATFNLSSKVKTGWREGRILTVVNGRRLRWVGGLGRDLNLEEGQFQSPMEGGCPDKVSMELPIASNLVTVPVMWDGSVSC
ncbi:hypothetical protein LWI29_019289 [Acer saccharum]|uniref:Uncharacterized protein n=1 Tax=Acer saccharum TaxID=4024 RepID=A0AA39RDG0_ACESA|nr:hypothetical protein LWI29_019289 [Acer saccharum]